MLPLSEKVLVSGIQWGLVHILRIEVGLVYCYPHFKDEGSKSGSILVACSKLHTSLWHILGFKPVSSDSRF